jgi:adenylate cyclase class 2
MILAARFRVRIREPLTMLEIEQKFASADFASLERKLASWGITTFEQHDEEDQYLAPPDRDFRITGEAFRLRRVGKDAFFTYKGPKQKSEVKARVELELPLPPGDDMPAQYMQLLHHLGYMPVAIVRKHRKQYSLTRAGFTMQICLDDVEELGRFAEVEIVAPEDRLREAEKALLDLAAELSLENVERRSYLTMLLAKRESAGGARS